MKTKSLVSKVKKSKPVNMLRYTRAMTASAVHGFPASKLTLIGVTGTDGKTTTCNLIYHFLKNAKFKVGLVSTISARIFDGEKEVEYDTGFHVTSPDSFDIQRYLKQMVEHGCTHAVIETTSHALAQERYSGINFDVGVITNITHEHLDYHETYDKYVLAKAMLFRTDSLIPVANKKLHYAVLNHDDKSWELLQPYVQNWRTLSYGFSDFSMFHVVSEKYSAVGTDFVFEIEKESGDTAASYSVHSPLMGRYNISNVIGALTAVYGIGVSLQASIESLASFPQLAGRFERFATKEHGLVVVDFAHTPNALRQVLTVGKDLTKGKLIAVFGCAGLRDRDKRLLMGNVAGELADITIITAEDPRTESLSDISGAIANGLKEQGAEEYPSDDLKDLKKEDALRFLSEHMPMFIRIDDRRKAIETAIMLAGKDDVVMVCGKGHEKSMCFGEEETPWSDQEVVQKAISKYDQE